MLVACGNGPREARRRLCNGWPQDLAGSGRQEHADRRPAADGARRLDAAAVSIDEMADDREAEPGPPFGARAARVHAIEPLEDARQMLRRDADAGVAHIHPHAIIRLA